LHLGKSNPQRTRAQHKQRRRSIFHRTGLTKKHRRQREWFRATRFFHRKSGLRIKTSSRRVGAAASAHKDQLLGIFCHLSSSSTQGKRTQARREARSLSLAIASNYAPSGRHFLRPSVCAAVYSFCDKQRDIVLFSVRMGRFVECVCVCGL
jgi:hypothetical protein